MVFYEDDNDLNVDLFSLLVFDIEKIIVEYDEAARFKGIRLTDSNVKSALSKVKKHLEGGSPGFPEANEREKMMAFMSKAIIKMIDENSIEEDEEDEAEDEENEDGEESGPFFSDWLIAVEGIEESMKTRKNPFPDSGARNYLDFVTDFIQSALKAEEKSGRKRRFEYKNSKIPRCGLCGATENLTKTECCDTWICDDEDKYVMFSYERSSCHRNHDRYTLCSYHHKEKHPGHWKTCGKCKKEQKSDIEMFAHMGTNEYNFEYLDEIPSSEPKRCQKCSKIINQGKEGYMVSGDDKYTCSFCNEMKIPDFTKSNKLSDKS